MFDSLDDKIKQDNQAENTTQSRILRWVASVVVCLAVFAGIYLAIRMLE